MLNIEPWEIEALGRLALAGVLGGVVGLEREYHGRAAGFRTHMLVSVGCCLVMVVSLNFARHFAADANATESVLRIDPARLAYSVMGGIGFLGAGAIVKSGLTIRGLTTAASIWCIAAIGLACGFGMYLIAIFTAAATAFSLFVLHRTERAVRSQWYKTIRVTCEDRPDQIEKVRNILKQHGVSVLDVAYKRDMGEDVVAIRYAVRYRTREQTAMVYRALTAHGGLRAIRLS
jgi:putative Mg2+ transporter-C (MgtC) family protein